MTFREYAAQWIESKCPAPGDREPAIRRSTWKLYWFAMRKATRFFGDRNLATIKPRDVSQCLKWMQDGDAHTKPCAASTVRSYSVALSQMFDAAIEDEHIETNPCDAGIRIFNKVHKNKGRSRKPKRRADFPPTALIEVLEECRQQMEAQEFDIILIMAYTGMRIGEALAIKPSCDHGDELVIEDGYSHGEFYSPKSGDPRTIPIESDLRIVLDRCQRRWVADSKLYGHIPCKYLLYTYDKTTGRPTGKIHSRYKISRKFKKAVEAVCEPELGWLTAHSLRHTWVTNIMREREKLGLTIEEAMELTGHKDRRSLENYNHAKVVIKPSQRAAMDRFGQQLNVGV